MTLIWVASYPRSGNTLLRTVLWHCLGLRSASVYPNDLGGNKDLQDYVGHIERNAQNAPTILAQMDVPLLKTHEYSTDNNPAIYIIRNGIDATESLWQFYHGQLSLEGIISGKYRFGTWSAHLEAWQAGVRANSLLTRYEDMMENLPAVVTELGRFLGRDIKGTKIPDRENIASVDGRWVRSKRRQETVVTGSALELFNRINKEKMREMGYLRSHHNSHIER